MTLTIIQLASFVADWNGQRLTDEDLQALEQLLLKRPGAGPVVPGTGGLRKMRFAPKSRGCGKSGGNRIIYAYFDRYSRIYLILMYGKNEQANLTAAEKKECRRLIGEIEDALDDESEDDL